MNDKVPTFRLLIAHESLPDAERLADVLRDAERIEKVEVVLEQASFAEALMQGSWDLLLVRPLFDNCDLASVMALVRRYGRTVPVVVLHDELNASVMRVSLQLGACAVVQHGDTGLLQQVLEQQFNYAQERRDQQQTALTARELRQSLAAIMSHSRDGIAYIKQGMHVRSNEAYRALFGVANESELAAVTPASLVAESEQAAFQELLEQPLANASVREEIFTATAQEGAVRRLNISFVPLNYAGGHGIQLIVSASETPKLAQQLQTMKQLDALTGLYHRDALMDYIDKALAATGANQAGQYAVLHVRLANFFSHQSRLGIKGADEVLLRVVRMLQENVPENTILARIGGFEFGLLFPISKLEDAEALAQHLCQRIEGLLPAVSGATVHLLAHIGVAFVQEESHSANQVMTRALNCCNRAEEGRLAVYVYDPFDEVEPGSDAAFALSLKKALADEGLVVRYQPILKLTDNEQQLVEVTATLREPNGEEVPAEELMPIAVSYGLNQSIDQLVVTRALKEAATLAKPPRLLINVSGHSVQAAGFTAWLSELLPRSGYNPSLITFQIPQVEAHHFLRQVQNFVVALAAYGCRFAVSGYAGSGELAAVHRYLPVSLVKCAPDFVHLAADAEQRERLVEAVAAVKEKGTEVLVPCVESAQQMQAVWTLAGVDYLQGSYLQQPSASIHDALGDE